MATSTARYLSNASSYFHLYSFQICRLLFDTAIAALTVYPRNSEPHFFNNKIQLHSQTCNISRTLDCFIFIFLQMLSANISIDKELIEQMGVFDQLVNRCAGEFEEEHYLYTSIEGDGCIVYHNLGNVKKWKKSRILAPGWNRVRAVVKTFLYILVWCVMYSWANSELPASKVWEHSFTLNFFSA